MSGDYSNIGTHLCAVGIGALIAKKKSKIKRFKVLVTTCVLAWFTTIGVSICVAAAVTAQAKCGGIEGRVTTPEGWLIPRAKIFFVDKESKKSSNVESNEDGEYEACLSPGTYDVTVNALGFKSAKRKGIKVNYGERNVIDFPLKRGRPVTSH